MPFWTDILPPQPAQPPTPRGKRRLAVAVRRFLVWTPAVVAAVCAAAGLAVLALQSSTPPTQPTIHQTAAPTVVSTVVRPALIDFNTATETELATLPGIGSQRAAAIVSLRARQPFRSLADLADRGILRPAEIAALADLATVYVTLD